MNNSTYWALTLILAIPAAAANTAIQRARTVLVDLDARDLQAGQKTWKNRTSHGDFTKLGSPRPVLIGSQAAIQFDGVHDAFIGPKTPASLEGASPRTVELWVYNPTVDALEEAMVSWGKRGGPAGTAFSFNYGNSPGFGAVTHWAADLGWISRPVTGAWHHLVYTYDGQNARIYDNGARQGERAVVLNTAAGQTINLAVQNGPDGRPQFHKPDGTSLGGSIAIASVRIMTGVLSPEQIAANFRFNMEQFGAKPGVEFEEVFDKRVTIESQDLALSLIENRGIVASLGPKSLNFDFTPGDRLKGRISSGFYHLGDVNYRARTGAEAWKTFSTVRDPQRLKLSKLTSGFSADLTETVQDKAPLSIIRNWLLEDGRLILRIKLANRTTEPVEVGALGVAMVFNNDFSKRNLDDTHEKCSFADPYVGGEAGYLQVTRVNGAGPVMLVIPEKGNTFEAYRPLREDPVPVGITHEGKYEWVIHSKAYAETEWAHAKQWNAPTSRILKPGEEATYGFQFVLSPTIREIEQTLAANSRPVVVGVPGYVLPLDQTGRFFIHAPAPIAKIRAEPEKAIAVEPLKERLKDGWQEFQIKGRQAGPCRLTVYYSDGTSQFIHYNVIPPANEQVRRLAKFHETRQWFTDKNDPFKRAFSYMFWDRQEGMLLQEPRSWNVGLSDECGAGPNLLMAVKNLMTPEPNQIRQLEGYVDQALWGNLQNQTNFGIRASLFYYQPDLFPSNVYTVKRGWNKARTETTWRAYNYPHQAAIYWCLYRLARFYDGLVTSHDWQWYLEHACRTSLAMRDHCGPNVFRNLAQFGLMDGTVFIEILRDLRREGWAREADEFQAYMRSRAKVWEEKRYPFGSEMPWDSTGQEEVYGWCRHFGLNEKASVSLNAVVAYTPVVPNWAYNGSARRYFDSLVYGKYRGVSRGCLHYGASLNAIPLLDAFRHSPADFHLLQAGFAGANGVLANIDANGHGSMLFCADPAIMDWEPYSGDYGCAFFGHALNAGAYTIKHPIFGWLGFGCDVNATENHLRVVPRDAFGQKVFIAEISVWITLTSGKLLYVELDRRNSHLTLCLSPADTHCPKAYFTVVQTMSGHTCAPLSGVAQDKGLNAVTLGREPTLVSFNIN